MRPAVWLRVKLITLTGAVVKMEDVKPAMTSAGLKESRSIHQENSKGKMALEREPVCNCV